MRIAKPLLLITTPIGPAMGLYEGWRLAGGLVFIMAALMLVIAAAFGSVVYTIRKERAEEAAKRRRVNRQCRPPRRSLVSYFARRSITRLWMARPK